MRVRARMPRLAVPLAVLAVIACGGEASPPPETSGAADAPPGAPPVFATFDPATLRPGDVVLDLTVASAALERVFEDSVWVGEVVFEGDLVVHGIYQLHPDWPQVELPCVELVQAPSIARIPRFPADAYTGPDPRTWFCLENAELAVELLGPPEPPREIVIALSRYTVRRQMSDVFDTAELAEVLEVGPTASRTLTEPR